MLPLLGAAPPLPEWGAGEIAIDALHQVVYAASTAVAYEVLV
jgi:hypothetical protein